MSVRHPARSNRGISIPMGPSPFFACTTSIATAMSMRSRNDAYRVKNPTMSAIPPRNSTAATNPPMNPGSGIPMLVKNCVVPFRLMSFERPCRRNTIPIASRRKNGPSAWCFLNHPVHFSSNPHAPAPLKSTISDAPRRVNSMSIPGNPLVILVRMMATIMSMASRNDAYRVKNPMMSTIPPMNSR